MPEWFLPLVNSPLAGGLVSGLLFLGGVKVELRRLDEKARAAMSVALRADGDIRRHIERHHVKA